MNKTKKRDKLRDMLIKTRVKYFSERVEPISYNEKKDCFVRNGKLIQNTEENKDKMYREVYETLLLEMSLLGNDKHC